MGPLFNILPLTNLVGALMFKLPKFGILTRNNAQRIETYTEAGGNVNITGSPLPNGKQGLDTAIYAGGGLGDAFGRFRVGQPQTLFDSKQVFDNQPLFWDDAEVSGAGTGSTYNTNESSTTLDVSATTAGKRVRQTYQRFNYQPGKSQLIVMTGILGSQGTDIQASMGYFDDENGVFLKNTAGITLLGVRSYTTGSAVDTLVSQANWNIDTFDGSGDANNPSGILLDWDKTQIFFMDLEWLGVGRVRCGFYVDGIPYYAHEFLHTNLLTEVYMTSPNLPLRYEIEAGGTNPNTGTITAICGSVISEGGSEKIGTLQHVSNGSTRVDANVVGTYYAVLGIRLKSAYIGQVIELENYSMINTQSGSFEWRLILNPTVAGTFTYGDKTNSAVQTATGATANTITGGTVLDGGYAAASGGGSRGQVGGGLKNALKLGAAIDGTVDEIVLAVNPLSANEDIFGSLTWRELS